MVTPAAPRPGIPLRCSHCTQRGSGVFCALNTDAVKKLDGAQTENLFKKGQILFYEGNPAVGVYCVASGEVKLSKTGAGGRPQILGIVGPGTLMGHRSLLTNQPHTVTAEALVDSRVCFFEKKFFLDLLNQEPSVSIEVLKKLSQDLDAVEDRLLDLVEKPVPVRLARLLLMLKEVHGRPSPKGVVLTLGLTREEMAEMIGTTQETTIRLLSRFKQKGYLRLDKRTIVLADIPGLLKVARLSL